jgi:cohesin complex subunit SA-1/2
MDSPSSNASSPNLTARRRSGRVPKKPQHLSEHIGVPSKRKRGIDEPADDDDVEMLDSDEEDDEESDEDEVDEEELKARRKRARKSTATKARAPKKAKENGEGASLAIRSVKGPKASKPRGKRAVRFSAVESGTGLYGNILGFIVFTIALTYCS